MNKDIIYEKIKKIIYDFGLDHRDYEEAIKELARILEI